jgi:hypothetical protein
MDKDNFTFPVPYLIIGKTAFLSHGLPWKILPYLSIPGN